MVQSRSVVYLCMGVCGECLCSEIERPFAQQSFVWFSKLSAERSQ